MFKYSAIFLAASALGLIFGWLPSRSIRAVRNYELKLLHKVYVEGPGGFDDAVQTLIISHPDRYSATVVSMLLDSKPGSAGEDIALSFIEFVRGEPEIDRALDTFRQRHPDDEVRKLVASILDSPAPKHVAP